MKKVKKREGVVKAVVGNHGSASNFCGIRSTWSEELVFGLRLTRMIR